MAEPLPLPLRRWCMAAAGACLLPLLLQLPPGLATTLGLLAALGYAFSRPWPGPLRIGLVVAAMGYLFFTFGFSVGRDTGTALLATLLAVKPGETRSLRDARSLLGFSLFAPFAAFLQDQGPLVLVLSLVALGALLVALSLLAEQRPGAAPARVGKAKLLATGRAVLVALPLAMAAFFLFPRLAVPLWGMPENALGAGGLGESMTPDEWIDLFSDDAPALRVRFLDAAPPPEDLYWRAQVLWNFDGRSWTRERDIEFLPPPQVTLQGRVVDHEVTLEPTEQRYLVVLDPPLEAPEGGRLLADGTVVTPVRVDRLQRYTARAAPSARWGEALPDPMRRLALRLPADSNPRTAALGRQWRAESGGDDLAVVQRALDWIGAEFSYSLSVRPTGRHSVDEFLFETKLGFCQHFSSSFAVLMRSAGIPTRVVLGYYRGTRNSYADYWTVRRMDAHAWNEVWLAGRGWVRVDPTAAVAPDRILDTVADRQRAEAFLPGDFHQLRDLYDWARRGWNDLVLSLDAERQSRFFRPLGFDRVDATQLGLAFAVGAGLMMVLTLRYLMRGQPGSRDPLVAAWLQFVRRMRRAGHGKDPWEPPLSYGARLAARLPAQAGELESLSRRYAAARYAAGNLPDAERRELEQALRRFRPTRTDRRHGDTP